MNVLFEDAGKYACARLFSEGESSVQVELESGKRNKIKTSAVVLRFDKPEPAQMLRDALALADSIELAFIWEVAPADEFDYAELCTEYFGAKPSDLDKAALLLRLHGAPHYFARKGKGRYKKAPEAQVQAALAGIERKRLEGERIEAMAADLAAGSLPASVKDTLYKLLFKPDKNAGEYKALVLACQRSGKGVIALLREAGAINDALEFHMQRFFFEWFPKGTSFPSLSAPPLESLSLVEGQAFSIDDSATTEIDDAFTVKYGGDDIEVGIHIAAPALALKRDDAIDKVAVARLSTVYMPGQKFTMLPDSVVQHYTLAEGTACPVVSLYVSLDATTLALKSSRSAVEQMHIAANLRHDKLDALVTEESLAAAAGEQSYPFARELKTLFAYAQQLKLGREQVRGKPERFTRPDYSFAVADGRVEITTRKRGAPLDLIVSELMILANCTWGKLLADSRIPGIYRSQHGFGAMMRTRMGTEPRPHIGLGVPQYIWATSPLRRYTDMVNQWQLIAAIRHGATAALVAPFKPKDAMLFAIVGAFESAYKGYADHQNTMERFWTLKYLEQEAVTEADGEVLREGAVRLATLPLVLNVAGAQPLARGTQVRVAIGSIDFITLEVQARLLSVVEAPVVDQVEQAEVDEEEPVMTSMQIAVDTSEVVTAHELESPALAS